MTTNIQMPKIFTIGHSTHAIEQFIALLKTHGIETLADVRAFPGSKRHPQFNREALTQSLGDAGITYHHMVSLGGRRKRQEVAEPNKFWRNASFANYADYTKTEEFGSGLAHLEEVAAKGPTAIMCAEALWWRCHRRIIADEITKHGFAVSHIMSADHKREAERSPIIPGL